MFSNKIICTIALVVISASASVNAMHSQLNCKTDVTNGSINQNLQNINNNINDNIQNELGLDENINNSKGLEYFKDKSNNDSNEQIIIDNETNIEKGKPNIVKNNGNNNKLKFPDVLKELNNVTNNHYNAQNVLNKDQDTLSKINQNNIDKEDKKHCATNITNDNNKLLFDNGRIKKILKDIEEFEKRNNNLNNTILLSNNIDNNSIAPALLYSTANPENYEISNFYFPDPIRMYPIYLTPFGARRLNTFDNHHRMLEWQNNTNQRKIKQIITKVTGLEYSITRIKTELAETNKKLDTILQFLQNNSKEINNI